MSEINSEINYGSRGNEGDGRRRAHSHEQRPYWKRMHRSWPFWAGMALTFAALAIYVLSDNLALIPRRGSHAPRAGQMGQ